MAHTCPDCGCLCHCGGDIDDIDFGEDCEAADKCTHYLTGDCADPDDFHGLGDEPTPSPISGDL